MSRSAVVTYVDQHGLERRLTVRIDDDAVIPRFEQLRAQISVMVAVGRLEPAARLPTVRKLARQLDLAPGTVARAYRELETDGIIEGRGRLGTFVVDEPPHSEPLEERRLRVNTAAADFVAVIRQLGLDDRAALDAIESALVAEPEQD